MKKTVVIGASPNPGRYSYLATSMLRERGIETFPLGIRKGEISGIAILPLQQPPLLENIHTITLYLNPKNQEDYIDFMLSLKPERVIFNPGTENYAFMQKLEENGIMALEACTLVLLQTNQY
ncbi:CoA-binding protein [Persicobacter sp. CCB-QB2]|uniref:CoA-binding protein n=1 Tax=Persicobacter sp. CCB-QB2 TaxID=1561025 RepID=UPI0006A950CF|nr:CoA-binding protein [Persicobacter sp. CCB-QB2]